jgi:hypothetical protein
MYPMPTPQDTSGMYPMPTPQDTSGMYPMPTPQDTSGMYPMPASQDTSTAYSTQGGTAAYMQQSAPNPASGFEQTSAFPVATPGVPETAQERTAVISPVDIAEVPPAFLPSQRRGPRPALYWQDQG